MHRRVVLFLISALVVSPLHAQGLSAGLTTTNPPAIATGGSTAPSTGTIAMGSDGTLAHPLATDVNGNVQIQVKASGNLFSRITSSAATGSPTNVKASAGGAFGWWGINTLGSNAYLQIYNKASAPVIGTDTPVLTYPIASNSTFSLIIPNGILLSVGVGFAFTTDVAGTTATAAGTITSFGFIAS